MIEFNNLWNNDIEGDISTQIFISIFIFSKNVDFQCSIQELEDDVWDFWDINIHKVITTKDTTVVSWHCWESTGLSGRQKLFTVSNSFTELAKGTDELFGGVFAGSYFVSFDLKNDVKMELDISLEIVNKTYMKW